MTSTYLPYSPLQAWYVGTEDVEEDEEEFEEKMRKLTNELSEQFKESKELEGEIRKNLKGIGYQIK